MPMARAEMLIRRPVSEVFEAFVDPAITSRFWFTRGSGRLELVKQAIAATEGFAFVLAGAKALLEHDVILNLVPDRFPDGVGG
jgi:uncharacterized protein YndB with AHSA1/START domain